MQPRDWGSLTSAANSFFVDCGIVDTTGNTTIGNLGYLEGETVAVLTDGAVHAPQVVSDGEITITRSADRVVAGLPFEYQVSPMRMDITTPGGTTYGSKKRTSEVVASFRATSGASYGDDIDTFKFDWRTGERYGSPPGLFTGEIDVPFDGGFSVANPIIISGSDPLPCTARAIIARIEKTGR
jgi:hypothetical protein